MLKLNRKQVFSVVFASLVTVGSIGCGSGGNGDDSETSNEGNGQQQENVTQGNDPQGRQRQGQQRQGQQRQPMQQSAEDIEVSDEELKKFQDAQEEVSSVQEDSRSKMEAVVKDEGLSMERFQEISQKQMQQQQGQQGQQQQTQDLDISDEEMEKFKKARQKIMDIQKSVQQNLMEAVKDAGLSPQRYQEISRAMRSDKELQQRFQSMQSGNQGGQNQSMP